MKILYLCTDPGIPLYGRKGCSTHVRETVVTLQKMGHEVKVICSNTEGDEVRRVMLDVTRVEPFTSRKLGFDLRHILLDRRLWRQVRACIEQWKPDAIYERYSLYSYAGQKAQDQYGLPRVMEVNAFLTTEQGDRIKLMPLARRAERAIIRRAPRVIVVSEPLRRDVNKLGVPMENIEKMPMAVDLEKFNPAKSGAAVREQLGLAGKFVIGYVGTLSGWHGLRLLYDMARRMQDLGAKDFVFVVVGGEGEKLERNRAQAAGEGLAEEVRFVGSVSHDDVPEYIRTFDAAIIPDTTYWSSPAKLFEYQASGVPILAPSYPAIHEAMDHEQEGLIYEPLKTGQMAEMAVRLMNDPAAREAMGRAGRRRAEAEHSWLKNGEAILELFETLKCEMGEGGQRQKAAV